mgnify:FL=1
MFMIVCLYQSRVLQDFIQTSREENLEKHRFLVLSKLVDEANYSSITTNDGLTPAQRQEEFSKLWHVAEGEREQKGKNIKLRVEFVYPDTMASSGDVRPRGGGKEEPIRSTSENVDLIRKSLAAGGTSPSSGQRGTGGGTPSSPSAAGIYDANDLQILKSKYDTIVEYTVHLTAERDMIAAQLDVLKREYSNMNEQNKKKEKEKDKDGKSSPRKGGKGGREGEGQQDAAVQQSRGFSVVVLLLIAFVSLLLGRYS